MSRTIISIIVPVYKSEELMHKCVDSILSQNLSNFELILVNDGSPDSCPVICDEYSAKDERVRVVHKENGGVADARNTGLRIASGDYIMFADDDDYLSANCLTDITELAGKTGVDVIIGKFECLPELGARYYSDAELKSEMINNRPSDAVLEYLSESKFRYVPWRFIVKREFIQKNDLYFWKGILQEDEEWIPRLLCCADSFWFYEKPFYCYRPRASESQTAKLSITNYVDWLKIAKRLYEYSLKYENPIKKQILLNKAQSLIISSLIRYRTTTKENREIIKKQTIDDELIIRDVIKTNHKWFLLVKIFGLMPGSQLYIRLLSLKTGPR